MKKLFFFSIIVSLAGFLFGFDTVVISGADQELERLWDKGPAFHGWVVMSSALWGTVIGAIFGGFPTDLYGRKPTLIGIGILYVVSAIGSALANDPWVFAIFRFLGGLGVGASTIAAPAYISEIAPAERRGRLVALYQFNLVLGILIAFISNYLLSSIPHEAWRWMVGVEAIPAFIFAALVTQVSESPRWLIHKRNAENEARKILSKLYDKTEVDQHISAIKEALNERNKSAHEGLFMKKYRRPVMLAFFIAFFNQFSGINAFLYYAPRIFAAGGMGESSAFFSSIGIGVVNLLFTIIGMTLIDKFGRRQLLIVGSVGYIISLSLVAMAFLLGWKGMILPIFFFLFIASHAIGQGAIIWVFIAEIFPDHIRASGQAFGSSVHWILAALIPALIPSLFSIVGTGIVFLFFAIMMVWQLIWALTKMPETKGKTLGELQAILVKE